jgi:hypothetical protein
VSRLYEPGLTESEHKLAVEEANQFFDDADALYTKAMLIEPACLEGLAQGAQLHILRGKFNEAVALLERALPLSRSREEVQELGQMLGQARAQVKAIAFLSSVGI